MRVWHWCPLKPGGQRQRGLRCPETQVAPLPTAQGAAGLGVIFTGGATSNPEREPKLASAFKGVSKTDP